LSLLIDSPTAHLELLEPSYPQDKKPSILTNMALQVQTVDAWEDGQDNYLNIDISFTLPASQKDTIWRKAEACLNMCAMVVTLDVSQDDKS
jgi:hypothetical protein